MQNDTSIPADYRAEASKWGFCKDEFVTNNNIPRQIYVREARRIEGRYFLTQNDGNIVPSTARTKIQPTSIGIAEYPFDSHACHKYNPLYPGTREGYFYVRHEPFQIPYGVLVPKNVEGLLVTVCMSSSHVAFQALRMEPLYMCMGQVAGIAAAQAIKTKVNVGDINIAALQKELVAQKGIITYFDDVYVDDPDFAAFQLVGAIGGTRGYTVTPNAILSVQYAFDALNQITGKQLKISGLRMNNLTAKQLNTWASVLGWPPYTASTDDVMVRQFVIWVYGNI